MKDEKGIYEELNKLRTTCNEELYEDIADEEKLSIAFVKEIVNSHSFFITQVIKSGSLESVILPYLGKLKIRVRFVKASLRAKLQIKDQEATNENRVI